MKLKGTILRLRSGPSGRKLVLGRGGRRGDLHAYYAPFALEIQEKNYGRKVLHFYLPYIKIAFMSPENAKVYIAEDNISWQRHHKEALFRGGHSAEIVVDSFDEGLVAISEAKEKDIKVALLDGKLSYSSSEGAQLSKALRKAIPEIKIVDVSAFGNAIKDADAKMSKIDYDLDELAKLVTDL